MPKLEVLESITVNASPSHVKSIVRDFKQWEQWSPWLSAEPNCPLTYKADGSGYSWDGKIIGSGSLDINSETDSELNYTLQFFKPWKSSSDVSFRFVPKGEGTEVIWTMKGSLPFFMFFMTKMMKAMIGSDYRRGLSKLKDYTETGTVPSKHQFKGVGDGLVSDYIGIKTQAALDEIGEVMSSQFTRLKEIVEQSHAEVSAEPISIYHKFDMVKQSTVYTAAIPVKSVPEHLPPDIVAGHLNSPTTYCVEHTGPYRHLGNTWSAGIMHQRSKVFRPKKGADPFEIYKNDPSETPENGLVTEVHFPTV